jgi:SAM-dependent methyltransferase|tara:strand:- start:3168 stop:3671 length:504 start_codon:yes stop_codon:yes gene_type:complete
MPSELRTKIWDAMAYYADQLKLKDAEILDIGTAGDELRPDGKPGGNYRFFGEGNKYRTMDVDPVFKPDTVGDICNMPMFDESYDLIICSQTLEHVWDFKKAIKEIHRVTRRYAIIDCPFIYPYHPEKEFGDYWRFSITALEKLAKEAGFKKVEMLDMGILTIGLMEK